MNKKSLLPSALALYHYKHDSLKIVHEVFHEVATATNVHCQEAIHIFGEDRLFYDIEFFSNVLYNSGLFASFETLEKHLVWRYRLFMTRGVRAEYFLVESDIFMQKIRKYLYQAHALEMTQLFQNFKNAHHRIIEKTLLLKQTPLAQHVLECRDALLSGSFDTLLSLSEKTLGAYGSFFLFFQEVVSQSLYVVGEMWEKNEISVAKEHLATSLAAELLEHYNHTSAYAQELNVRVIVATLENELHFVGAKSVATFLDSRGFQTLLLAKIKKKDLITMLYDYKPQALLLSVTLVSHLDTLANLIEEIRENTLFSNLNIIVGGQALADKTVLIAGSDFHATSLEALEDFLLQKA